MDTTNVLLLSLQAIISAFCIVLWNILNGIRGRAEKNSEEIANLKLTVAEKYASKSDMKDAIESITQAFERHANRVDQRIDRLEQRLMEMKDKKE